MHNKDVLTLSICAFVILAPQALCAQCDKQWFHRFSPPGVHGTVLALASFDEVGAPGLLIGGDFEIAGNSHGGAVSIWNGSYFTPFGIELDDPVWCFGSAIIGGQRTLFLGGDIIDNVPQGDTIFYIAQWSGDRWVAVPGPYPLGDVRSLCAFDDGTGEALYVGGEFRDIGSERFNYIAQWDGQTWQHLGNGLSITGFYVSANAMKVYDDGRGPALYVGGVFTRAGDIDAYGIARWDGQSWEDLDIGTSGPVNALEVYDDGDGPALYAGGTFTYAGEVLANHIAKWDGVQWSALGGGVDRYGAVYTLKSADIGGVHGLYVGGEFNNAGGMPYYNLARWDGVAWNPVGAGIELPNYNDARGAAVYALETYDEGGGEALFIGGLFDASGDLGLFNLARWDGERITQVGRGEALDRAAYVLDTLDWGDGPHLVVGGAFQSAGLARCGGVARRTADGWQALGGDAAMARIYDVMTHDDGTGTRLFTCGTGDFGVFGVFRLEDSGAFSTIGLIPGAAVPPLVRAMAVYDDGRGDALYAAGRFTQISGVMAESIARWDGVNWEPLGSGLSRERGTPSQWTYATSLLVYDDGTGPALYVGGSFTHAGGILVNGVAKWDGLNWRAVGTREDDVAYIHSLEIADLGEGVRLYAGGSIDTIGGVPVSNLAAWDGSQWHDVGGGVGNGLGSVYALKAATLDGGPQLLVGGLFRGAGPLDTQGIARWDGANWHEVGGGMDTQSSSYVYSIEVFDDGDGPAIWLGGDFEGTSAGVSLNIARFGCVRDNIVGDLNCDGRVNAFDIDAFVLALQDAARYAEAYPDCRVENADINRDGIVNNFDVDLFVELLE